MDEMTMSVADVLRKAIDVLEERGWHQGSYDDLDGRVCLLAALHETVGQGDVLPAYRALCRNIGQRSVSAWNDDPSRTYEDVVLALKQAAYDAEAQR